MSRIALVVARATNGVIGDRGRIPWRIPEDLRRFKQLTVGKPCIMGRRTWESLPKKPLPERSNIVVTRDRQFIADGAVVVHSFEGAIANAEAQSANEIAIIGGEAIYRAALPRADVIYLTEVLAEFPGDARFPPLDPSAWRETSREEHVSGGYPGYGFVTLDRMRD